MEKSRIVQLQEIHSEKGEFLRFKGRDGKYRFLNTIEIPETDLTGITYSALKTLRDDARLEPGMLYRITDYQCTTTQEGTRSAGHQFDIVVMALDSKTLAERAWAMPHDGDEYFKNSKLEAWQLWYCLDNDKSRFAWADDNTPQIMDDEEGIWAIRDASKDNYGMYAWYIDSEDEIRFTKSLTPQLGDAVYSNATTVIGELIQLKGFGRGVIYRMIDEHENDAPYDFKNLQFKRFAITELAKGSDDMKAALIYDEDENPVYFGAIDMWGSQNISEATFDEDNFIFAYTFDCVLKDADGNLTHYDMSSRTFKGSDEFIQFMDEDEMGEACEGECYKNVISPYGERENEHGNCFRGLTLPNIVFFGEAFCYFDENEGYWSYGFNQTYGNVLGVCCQCITFGNRCSNNTFGNSCNRNTFGNNCQSSTFGNGCGGNTFGNNCGNNTFGNSCSNNTFGNGCYGNTFGNWFSQNTFGNGCSDNTFGNSCSNNTFGNNCQSSTFGNNCGNNTFGNNCQSSTFGNDCYNNTFGNNCYRNTFGNDCYNNTFGNSFEQSCIGDGVNNITVSKDYVRFIIIENGNQKITITSTATTSSSQYIRNIAIALGTNNSNSGKTISHNTTNDTFKTTYQNANSDVVDV